MTKLKNTIQIKGIRYPRTSHATKAWLDSEFLSPIKSQAIKNLSYEGFGWGEDGLGAAQLAFAICLELYPDDVAKKVYRAFSEQFIFPIKSDGFILEINLIEFQEKHVVPLLETV